MRPEGQVLEIIKETYNNIDIYRLKGQLDSNSSPEFEQRIFQAISNGSKNVVVDFKCLDYISSAGIRVILRATKAIKRKDGQIMLCCMHDYVKEVFDISGVGSLLSIVATLDDALQSFSGEQLLRNP
jgi:anti-sigma B factor antagonist